LSELLRRGLVLVADQDPRVVELAAERLEQAGYEVRVAADAPRALELAVETRPDLLISELGLPGSGGLEVMRRARRFSGRPLPVIIVGAGTEADRINSLRVGADDFLTKPFWPSELVARVDALLRRAAVGPPREPIMRNGLEIAPPRRVVARGAEVELTKREFELLLFLAGNPGTVFTRAELMERVWQTSFYGDMSTVTVHIRRLRTKIEADPSQPHWLQTVWGVGYRFKAD